VRITQGYGLTESTQATCLDEVAGSKHPDSIGRPFPLTEVRIHDEHGVEVKEGEVGELQIRGPATTRSYWNRPEETAATFLADGWMRTGDLARTVDGLLFLSGRKKDMIRSGGENISAVEVEKVLTAHAAILDAAVIAVPHPRFLEVGCAVIVTAPDAELSDDEIFRHCRTCLAGYKCPKHVVRVDELPRNANGKVLKAELRARYRSVGEAPARA
jgi:fatty-acyl-CoA synthase